MALPMISVDLKDFPNYLRTLDRLGFSDKAVIEQVATELAALSVMGNFDEPRQIIEAILFFYRSDPSLRVFFGIVKSISQELTHDYAVHTSTALSEAFQFGVSGRAGQEEIYSSFIERYWEILFIHSPELQSRLRRPVRRGPLSWRSGASSKLIQIEDFISMVNRNMIMSVSGFKNASIAFIMANAMMEQIMNVLDEASGKDLTAMFEDYVDHVAGDMVDSFSRTEDLPTYDRVEEWYRYGDNEKLIADGIRDFITKRRGEFA